jgi:hypothetical protein
MIESEVPAEFLLGVEGSGLPEFDAYMGDEILIVGDDAEPPVGRQEAAVEDLRAYLRYLLRKEPVDSVVEHLICELNYLGHPIPFLLLLAPFLL